MKFPAIMCAICSAVLAAGCSPGNNSSATQTDANAYRYTFTEEGSPETSNRQVFDSLGDVTFTRTQKYRLSGKSEAARQPHLLALTYTKTVGQKVITRDEAATIFVKDGNYTLDCAQYYDVKIAKGEDSVSDPRCSIKVLGVVKIDAPAELTK
ncbi:hypothetical protein [uncultured Sphingomonas sp.]|uniref:hypothetical protein n=1 Tax=uncultured Sphingomonas sp. TaxID=158754 RepID=UPI0025D5E1E1|nr:hypothetical protein [uncultured Sphingomonas sp.]